MFKDNLFIVEELKREKAEDKIEDEVSKEEEIVEENLKVKLNESVEDYLEFDEGMSDEDYYELFKQDVILAEGGDEAALHWLWLKLDNGIDIDSTSEWEYRWYYVMATNPNYCDTQAMMALYELYMEGIYVNKDEVEALKWLNKAVDLGDACALSERIYYNFKHNNLDKILNDYKLLLENYLKTEKSIELAIEHSFFDFDDELIDYLRQGYDVVQLSNVMNTNINLMLIKLNEMNRMGWRLNLPYVPPSDFLKNVKANGEC